VASVNARDLLMSCLLLSFVAPVAAQELGGEEAERDDWAITRERAAPKGRAARPSRGLPKDEQAKSLRRQRASADGVRADSLLEGSDGAARLLARARTLRERGQFTEARADLLAVLERKPSRAQRLAALRELMDLAVQLGQLEDARARARQLAESDPSGASDALARLLSQHGRHAEAAQLYVELADTGAPRARARWRAEAAAALLASGSVEAAQAQLRVALSEARGAVPGRLRDLALEAARLTGGLAELAATREIEARQGRPGAWLEAARAWEEQGEVDRAIHGYRAWLARTPADLDARSRLAELLVSTGRLSDAQAEYARLSQQAPNDVRLLSRHAALLHAVGRQPEALSLLARASARASSSPELRGMVRELYLQWGEPDRAARELERTQAEHPDDAAVVIAQAERALSSGDRAAAIGHFRKLLALERKSAAAHASLARAFADHDLLPEAIEQARRAVELALDQLAYRRTLASLLERAGHNSEAEAAWQALLDHPRADGETRDEARQRLVSLWTRTGSAPRRLLALQEQLRAQPHDLESARWLAALYGRDAQYRARELSLLEQLATQLPSDREVLLALANAHERRGDPAAALRAWERVLERPEGASAADLVRALELAARQPQSKGARELFERALRHRPADLQVQRAAARFWRALGERARSQAAYARVVELDPTDDDARLMLAELELAGGANARALALIRRVLAQTASAELAERAVVLLRAFGDAQVEATLQLATRTLAQQPLARKLLLAHYARTSLPSAKRALEGTASDRERAELSRTVVRALGPLLSALATGDAQERSLALALLAAAPSEHALGALLATAALPSRSFTERAHALIAVGRLGLGASEPDLRKLYRSADRRLRALVVWALAASAGQAAADLLREAVQSSDETTCLLASLWLGQLHDDDDATRAALQARLASATPMLRAALHWALRHGERADELPAAEPDDVTARSLLVIARAPDDPRVAQALFAQAAGVRRTAAAWLALIEPTPLTLPTPILPLSSESYLAQVLAGARRAAPPGELTDARWRTVAAASVEQLTRPERAGDALPLLLAIPGGLAPRALIEAGRCPTQAQARSLADLLQGPLAALTRSGSVQARTAALKLLIASGGGALPEVLASLRGSDRAAQRSALEGLAALAELPHELDLPLTQLLDTAPDWPTRRLAALALRDRTPREALRDEPIALVRSAREERRDVVAPSCRSTGAPETAN
jgi:predicted Zn-dependent protease